MESASTHKSAEVKKETPREASHEGERGEASGLPLFLGAGARSGASHSGAGQPLDGPTRAFFEPRFNSDFGGVRVHTGGEAASAARSVNAAAFTVGRNIAFDQGQFAPGTHGGRTLLAHELAHVVQQSRGGDSAAPPAHAESEADSAARRVTAGGSAGALTPVGRSLQRQPNGGQAPPQAKQVVARTGKQITILTTFRDDFLTVVIDLDEKTQPAFDSDAGLGEKLGTYLTGILNPPSGPYPENKRFLGGARVKGLIEQDLLGWIGGGGLPSLIGLLEQRAEILRRQRVRQGLEEYLALKTGDVDWNAQIPTLKSAMVPFIGDTVGEESKLDRAYLFLDILQNEVAGNPSVAGATTPAGLAKSVFEYATRVVKYDDEVRKAFAEKFLLDYLNATAAIRFIPEGFDLTRFKPNERDVAESRRNELVDNFVAEEAEALATKFLLDKWTASGQEPASFLSGMNLKSEKDGILDHLAGEFMKRAAKDRSLVDAIREVAADKARYELLKTIWSLAHLLQIRNQSLPAIAGEDPADLDPDDLAIVHDPATYYETTFYLAQATTTIFKEVSGGAEVGPAVVASAQAIAGKAQIPRNFGGIAEILKLVTAFGSLKQTVTEQREKARQRIADRISLSWEKIRDVIERRGQIADDFIQKDWIPMVKKVAQDRIEQNYNDIKKWLDNFGGETANVIGRYRLAAYFLEEVANTIDSGEQETATLNGQVLERKDVPQVRHAVATLRAQAEKLETKKGKEEKRAELEKAVSAFADVQAGITSGKYKPENFGPSVFQEARKRLKIPEYEPYTTVGAALTRRAVTGTNPFQAWAIQRWQYVEKVHEMEKQLAIFAAVTALTVASFLVPGAAAVFLGAVVTGFGVYQGAKGVQKASAAVDLARLDTDLTVQGVTVDEAQKALRHAWISMVVELVLAGLFAGVAGAALFKGVKALRLPSLTKLAEVDAAMAAKIVERAGGNKLANTLLEHFAGDAAKVWEALAYTKDGKSLATLIGQVKDADLCRRLLISSGGESGLVALLKRFKNLPKLEELLGSVPSAEKLVTLFDLAKSETAVTRVIDSLGWHRGEQLLNGGLSADQAIALNGLGEPAVANYLKLLETGDPALKEGMRQLLRVDAKGKLGSAVVEDTLNKTTEFMAGYKGPAGSDFVQRFENIADGERKLAEARQELSKVKAAKGDTAQAQARVDQLTETLAKTRETSTPGKIRPVDVTPEELRINEPLQRELFEQCKGVQGRQAAMGRGVLNKLGIADGEVYNELKRGTFEEFRDGVLAKMLSRKGYKQVGAMDDMVRGRFNLETGEQVKQVVDELRGTEGFYKLSPPREASGVPGVASGYPRSHVIMKDPVTGITHEWQVGTKATTRLFEGKPGEIPEIQIPPGLKLKEGMHANIHDIEYDIFGSIQLSKDPAEAKLAVELGIPEFRRKVAETAAETGKLGSGTANLDARITDLHQEASRILAELVKRKGAAYVEHFYH